jgi:hypothetical protein
MLIYRHLLSAFEMFSSSCARPSEVVSLQHAKWFCNLHGFLRVQTLPEGLKVIVVPTTTAALPPSSNHKVLFVGVPVKARDTFELAESDASKP